MHSYVHSYSKIIYDNLRYVSTLVLGGQCQSVAFPLPQSLSVAGVGRGPVGWASALTVAISKFRAWQIDIGAHLMD